ncbi:probable sulfate transporter 3.5 isoform X2 [Camellia sinensis]|uniref:probable sulfate transporter 3.5 isoform X2 n=1 Tax=Camellia sinensis TaxID=4442 RepID=UPI0010356FEE|nr:probable sulfate transporter 3.5 isoform X2 [Camellia sinensis]
MANPSESLHKVNFANKRSFGAALKKDLKETFFPDDPFKQFENQPFSKKTKKVIQYFVPVFEWLPKYNLSLFKYDLLAGITVASLAIPQGISYAKLANIPPIIGLYSSFVPPLVYAVFGSSKHLAVGTVAACSLLISSIIGGKVSPIEEPELYLHLVFTATFFTGLLQTAMGFLRLGILIDFLSHSVITGFMGGTAIIIILQQLKGVFGVTHFTTKTDVVSVLRSIFSHRDEWHWQSAIVGIIFLAFLQFTRFVVGHLSKGINPLSIKHLNFDPKYISAPIQAGIITAMVALAEGIAIGRSFAIMKNEHMDGNKEMVAFGLMNIVGSFTSCYLTTGPFSKTAVNFNAGCKTQMTNVVMAICMMLTLLFLAPLFSYTPIVGLSAIIMSAMFGLIKYKKAYHMFKTDKFDFCICMVAFIAVAFISMDIGLMLSVGLSILRALLYVARPVTCKLGNIPNSTLYRDIEQYPDAIEVPGILILKLGSPIYFPNCTYIKERILRWVRDEQAAANSKGNGDIEHVLLDLGGVTSIDITGVETLTEVRRSLEAKGLKVTLVNPRLEVMEKLIATKFVDLIGKENVFLSIEDAIEACRFTLKSSKQFEV